MPGLEKRREQGSQTTGQDHLWMGLGPGPQSAGDSFNQTVDHGGMAKNNTGENCFFGGASHEASRVPWSDERKLGAFLSQSFA